MFMGYGFAYNFKEYFGLILVYKQNDITFKCLLK